jgi:hypothetical protein
MKKIRNLFFRCGHGDVNLKLLEDDIIRCELCQYSYLELKDLYTLIEEKGMRIHKIFAIHSRLYIDIILED